MSTGTSHDLAIVDATAATGRLAMDFAAGATVPGAEREETGGITADVTQGRLKKRSRSCRACRAFRNTWSSRISWSSSWRENEA